MRQKIDNVRQLYDYTLSILPRLFDDIDPQFWPVSVSDAELICYHRGNSTIYSSLQRDRLFEPVAQGEAWAFAA